MEYYQRNFLHQNDHVILFICYISLIDLHMWKFLHSYNKNNSITYDLLKCTIEYGLQVFY